MRRGQVVHVEPEVFVPAILDQLLVCALSQPLLKWKLTIIENSLLRTFYFVFADVYEGRGGHRVRAEVVHHVAATSRRQARGKILDSGRVGLCLQGCGEEVNGWENYGGASGGQPLVAPSAANCVLSINGAHTKRRDWKFFRYKGLIMEAHRKILERMLRRYLRSSDRYFQFVGCLSHFPLTSRDFRHTVLP
jgi:hypothetical protein